MFSHFQTKFFHHFALMQRDFGNLCKSDQLLLLGKNTPLYVQFVLATYFCASTGQDQLSSLLGKKYCHILEHQATNRHILRKITASEFCHNVPLFNTTADLSIWEKLLKTYANIALDLPSVPHLCLILLYDTNFSMSSHIPDNVYKTQGNQQNFSDSLKGKKLISSIECNP